jgi:hypothetical protein
MAIISTVSFLGSMKVILCLTILMSFDVKINIIELAATFLPVLTRVK